MPPDMTSIPDVTNLVSPSDESDDIDDNDNDNVGVQRQGQPEPQPQSNHHTKHHRFRNPLSLSLSLSKSKSKDKASCEYYNEDNDLEDGELPSLKGKVPPRGVIRTTHMNGNGNTITDDNNDNHNHNDNARPITPSPRNRNNRNRSATPVQSNTKEKKTKKGAGGGGKLRGRLFPGRNNNNNNHKKQDMDTHNDDNDDDHVTIEAPRLSPESKQKHRVFWTQLDVSDDDNDNDDIDIDNDSDTSTELELQLEHNVTADTQSTTNTKSTTRSTKSILKNSRKKNNNQSQSSKSSKKSSSSSSSVYSKPLSYRKPQSSSALNTSIESELPDDELAYRRRQDTQSVHDRIQRRAEVAEGDDHDDGKTGGVAAATNGIYNIINDICTDCAWMGNKLVHGDDNDDHSKKKDYTSSMGIPNNYNHSSRSDRGLSRGQGRPRGTIDVDVPRGFIHLDDKTPAMMDADDDEGDDDYSEYGYDDNDDNNNRDHDYSDYDDDRDNHKHRDNHRDRDGTGTVGSYESLASIRRAHKRMTRSHENTAIEVEYCGTVEEDEEEEECESPGRHGNMNHNNMNGPPRGSPNSNGSFLQLDLSGEVSSFVPSDGGGTSASASGANANAASAYAHSAYAHSQHHNHLMSKTQSWSGHDKNAYLQAMAKKAKEDFRKKKGLEVVVEKGKSGAGAVGAGEKTASRSVSPVKRGRESTQSNHIPVPVGAARDDLDTDTDDDDDDDNNSAAADPAEGDNYDFYNNRNDDDDDTNTLDGIMNTMKDNSSQQMMPRSKSFGPMATPQSTFMSSSSNHHGHGQSHAYDTSKVGGGGDHPNQESSPTGIADFPHIDLYQSGTASDIGARASNRNVNANVNVNAFALKKVQSDIASVVSSSSSKRSGILSFQRRKKWNKVGDEEDHSTADTTTTRNNHDASLNSESVDVDLPPVPSRPWSNDIDIDNNENVETPRPGDDIFDFDTNTKQDGSGGASASRTPMTSIKLDPYEDSCDVSILGSMIGPGDDASLYSSRSALTYGTNFTASSVSSTRHRHRGAAKKRVPTEEEEYQNGRPSGWLESIKAAADSTNRKWDPQRGWVDYVPPPDPVQQDVSRIGRLKSPVRRRQAPKKENGEEEDDRSYVSEASNVPFPPQWESERERMVRSMRDDYSTAGASAVTEVVNNTAKAKEHETPINENYQPPLEIETNRHKSRKQFELGAHETIEEGEDEGEPEVDNNAPDSSFIGLNRSIEALSEPNFIPVDKLETTEFEDDKNEGDENSFDKGVGTDWIEEGSREDKDASISYSITSAEVMGTVEKAPIPPPPPPKDRPDSPQSLTSLPNSDHVSVKSEGYVQFSPYAGKASSGNDKNQVKQGESFDDGPDDFVPNASFDFSATEDSNHSDDSDDGFKIVKERNHIQSSSNSITLTPSKRDTKKSINKEDQSITLSPSNRDTASQRTDASSIVSKNLSLSPSSVSGFSQKKTPIVPSSPANSMSSRAKDWLKKVEEQKQKNGKGAKATDDTPVSALFVSATDDNSTFEYGPRRVTPEADNDSVFEFDEEKKSRTYVRKNGEVSAPHFKRPTPAESVADSDHPSDSMSEITSPSGIGPSYRSTSRKKSRSQSETFFSRMQSCTAPMMDGQEGGNMPQSHLDFLKKATNTNANCAPIPEIAEQGQGQRLLELFQSQTFCGGMENVSGAKPSNGLPPRPPSSSGSGTKGRSSIASSYLQAIKEKASGYGTNNNNNNTAESVGGIPSVASTDSSKSESWQKFLEKRNRALESTSKRSAGSRGSKAAEQYASRKLEEIMANISSRAGDAKSGENTKSDGSHKSDDQLRPPSRSQSRPRNSSRGRAPTYGKSSTLSRGDAARAAEDLAAARVEAMMAMMSNSTLEEGEI